MDNLVATLCLLATVQGKALEPQVARLGSEDFRTRESAHLVIKKQLDVPWGEILAKNLPKTSGDLETDCRIRVLTAPFNDLLTDYGYFPWICALPKSYPDRQRIVSEYLAKAKQEGINGGDYGEYRYATYLYLKDLRNKGMWTSELRAIQRLQIPNELYWKQHNRYP